MTEKEASELIKPAIDSNSETQKWADLGCGKGLYSLALASLLPAGSHVVSIDQKQIKISEPIVGGVSLEFIKADFTKMELSQEFNGILMANSLHYVQDKSALLNRLRNALISGGKMVIIEYDTSRSNRWVPYPIPFSELQSLIGAIGFQKIRKIGERDSIFGPDKMYASEIIL